MEQIVSWAKFFYATAKTLIESAYVIFIQGILLDPAKRRLTFA
jgi:hypothetical protein